MASELYVIANDSNQDANFYNSDNRYDNAAVNAHTVVHTGGKDGNYCEIPKCSAEKYFHDHHMQVQGGTLNIAFWRNDAYDDTLYYSLNNSFLDGIAVQSSGKWRGVSMLIQSDNRVLFFSY